MTFNIVLLVFGLAALSAKVPLQSNAAESFNQGYISGDTLIPDRKSVVAALATGKKAKFADPTSTFVDLLPDVDLAAWEDYPINFATTKIGELDYVLNGYYDFHAAALNAWRGVDIKPSFWHFYDCQFKSIARGIADKIFGNDGLVQAWDYVSFIRGVVDKDECYGADYVADGTCPPTCPANATKPVYSDSVGKGILFKSVENLDVEGLKLRIANFGPVLVPGARRLPGILTEDRTANAADDFKVYYGWDGVSFHYITRDVNGFKSTGSETVGKVPKAYIAYSNVDCDIIANFKKLKFTRLQCDCPPIIDTIAWKLDLRITKKFCAAWSTRAAWAGVATVLLLPLLSML